jgi:hypothetical protein
MTGTCPHDALIWLAIGGVLTVCCEDCRAPMVLQR